MKRIYTLSFLLVLLSGLLASGLSSCHSSKKQQEQADSTQLQPELAPAPAPFPMDSILVRDTLYSNELAKSGEKLALDLTFRFPKGDSLLQPLFNYAFFGDHLQQLAPKEAMQKFIQLARQEYFGGDEAVAYEGDESSDGIYELAISNEISYADSLVLTITKDFSNYNAGAAHGMYATTFTNVDRRTKTLVNEDDLFVEAFGSQLSEILRRCILRDYKCASVSELQQKEGIDASEMAPNDNFSFDPQGLVYCFNPYEIAPYAVGRVYVHIPYEELRPILRPGSLIFSYLPAN